MQLAAQNLPLKFQHCLTVKSYRRRPKTPLLVVLGFRAFFLKFAVKRNMPHRHVLGAALLILTSCASLGDFDVDRTIAEQRVPGSPLAGVLKDLFAIPIPMDVDIRSEAAARNSGPAKAAHLRELVLRITATSKTAGDEDDFGFLDSVDVFLESTKKDTNLPRTPIARAPNIQPTEQIVFDVVGSVDVLPYADEGSRFTTDVHGSVPPDDVSFDGSFTLRVELF